MDTQERRHEQRATGEESPPNLCLAAARPRGHRGPPHRGCRESEGAGGVNSRKDHHRKGERVLSAQRGEHLENRARQGGASQSGEDSSLKKTWLLEGDAKAVRRHLLGTNGRAKRF